MNDDVLAALECRPRLGQTVEVTDRYFTAYGRSLLGARGKVSGLSENGVIVEFVFGRVYMLDFRVRVVENGDA